MGGKIILNSKVVKIDNESNNIKSIKYLVDSKETTLKCDYLVSSMPMKDLIEGMNNIPKNIRKISNGLPYRDFVTIGVLVPKLAFNDRDEKTIHGGINENWIYVQDPSVTMGRIQIFNNWSPYMV